MPLSALHSILDFFRTDIVEFWQSYLKEYTIALGIVVGFFIFSRLFARYLVAFMLYLTHKTKTNFDTKFVEAFKKPITLLIVLLGIYLAVLYVSPYTIDAPQHGIISSIFSTLFVILIFSGFYNLVDSSSDLLLRFGRKYKLDHIVLSFFSKVLRFVIIALSLPIIANFWGIDINGFVAGLGIGGLAFALAAQDALSNIFGGLIIITEKPFTIGDWILTPDVEGTVEDITFRSTRVRTFAQALVIVPNSSLAKKPITNWTRMGRRQISFHLRVNYSTPRNKLETCVRRIRQLLTDHPGIHPQTLFVNFDRFSDSSLDIFVYCFTRTTDWGEWLQVKEDILFKILGILEEEGVSVAFPSQSIYFENPFPGKLPQSQPSDEKTHG